ncbi:MAG: NifB/NifX family molybdenum-iron cluster-binding protein [Nitrospirae bacterium]|nr:NifB/NifX family molybdenum-iron cluster-binding protein [Nitrospirota bacterium]
MKLCFPIQKNDGMESSVFNHFGSAPMFVVVDTETNNTSVINNRNQHHEHGACNPLQALSNSSIDVVIVGGIGTGALSKLLQTGIKVYQANSGNVRENLAQFLNRSLPEFALQSCCSGHRVDGKCAH